MNRVDKNSSCYGRGILYGPGGGTLAIVAWVPSHTITSWTPHAGGNLMDDVCTTQAAELAGHI
jgi:hypothetical protein